MDCNQIVIDKSEPTPLTEQIANSVFRLIRNGEVSLGERLPTERDLAAKLGIARGTVKRAYVKLAGAKAIEIRQGSGSYVLANGRILEQSQKKEAAEIIAGTLSKLQAMGMTNKEIRNLINLQLTNRQNVRRVSMMVVSNNHEILAELEKQLSYLSGASQSFFTLSYLTLDNIRQKPDPVGMLGSYDLIIATSIDYPAMLALAPGYAGRIVEAAISPRTNTLIALSDIPKSVRLRIVYRTRMFLDMVMNTLLSMGFLEENILPCQEGSYHPEHHSEDGVSVVINHNESPVYTSPQFHQRNEAFLREGGMLLHFEYRIDRDSLAYIEERIHALMARAPGQAE